ncbi:hypothetical protein LSPH24S_09048 [Lysinibacillus sphaericus]
MTERNQRSDMGRVVSDKMDKTISALVKPQKAQALW